jgi:hypothetical protein
VRGAEVSGSAAYDDGSWTVGGQTVKISNSRIDFLGSLGMTCGEWSTERWRGKSAFCAMTAPLWVNHIYKTNLAFASNGPPSVFIGGQNGMRRV